MFSGVNGYDSDVDKDYVPINNDNKYYDSDTQSSEDGLPSNAVLHAPQTSRKRVRRVDTWKNVKAKLLRNKGISYVDQKGKTHTSKELIEYNHRCSYQSNTNLPEDIRKEIFKKYWETGNWELQTSFLNSAITLNPVCRKSATMTKAKSVSRIYTLGEFRVCHEFFKKTLCISNKRVQNIVNKKKILVPGVSPRDKRRKKTLQIRFLNNK